jgi:hypothetical protein
MFEANIKRYNTFINTLIDDVKDLIQLHYMTQREDTEFWKNYKYEVPKTEALKDISPRKEEKEEVSKPFSESNFQNPIDLNPASILTRKVGKL